jgi:hypothetical protein
MIAQSNMPDIDEHLAWIIEMSGDTVEVVLANRSNMCPIRRGSLDVSDVEEEDRFVSLVRNRAFDVLFAHENREERREWLTRNFR